MAKSRDTRYEAIKSLVQAGKLTSLQAVFDIIPKSTVATAAGIHYSTLHKKLKNAGLMKIEECILLADLFGLTPQEIMTLALNDLKYRPKTKQEKEKPRP